MTPTLQASSNLLAQLANPAARALVLAGAAGLALAAFRVKAASLRLFTWTAVLYGAVAMPVLGWMLPPMAIPIPAFLRYDSTQASQFQSSANAPAPISTIAKPASLTRADATSGRSRSENAGQALPVAANHAPLRTAQVPWGVVAAAIYFAGALLLLSRFGVGLVFSHRLLRASHTIHDSRIAQRLASRTQACGLAVVPKVAACEFISVPVTMGTFQSTILLPADWRDWDDAKLDAIIAHEMSHVARRDALTQRLSLLHRAIFWFSPLAWWLDRHLADLAEQASDEAALACGADRNDYARTLLAFFESLHATPGRVWWQGVSMAKSGQAEQRLERILAWRGAVTMGVKSNLKRSIAVAIIALAIPAVYLAASVRPASAERSSQAQTAPAPSATPAPAPEAAPAPASEQQLDGAPAAALAPAAPQGPPPPAARLWDSGVAPIAPIAPMKPMTPMTAMARPTPARPATLATWARQATSSYGHGNSYTYGYDDDQRFVIVTGKSDSLTMSGSSEEARHAEKLRKQIPGDFIWFERDEKSYIIRDQATVDRARKLWAPQEELGKKQEALGKQQEELGKQQEALGKRMEEIHVQVPDMTAEVDKLKAELKQLSSGATVEQVGRLQSEIGELQSKIGEIQSHAGDQQSKLGEEMGVLGEKQGKLGEQQGELGRQQGEMAEKASHQMKELLDEAIKNGTAKPEAENGGTPSL